MSARTFFTSSARLTLALSQYSPIERRLISIATIPNIKRLLR